MGSGSTSLRLVSGSNVVAAAPPRSGSGAGEREQSDRPRGEDLLKGRLALPVREVARLLGVSPAAVRLMIARGDLPGRKIGGGLERRTYVVPTEALLAWLRGGAA